MASLGTTSSAAADLDAEVRDFVADLDAWSANAKREDAAAQSEPTVFVPRDASLESVPIRGSRRATVTATKPDDARGEKEKGASDASSPSARALREGMPTLADLDAAERRLAGDGVRGLFAEAAKHGAGAKTEDLSVGGASRADREKLLAGLRGAPARERRWAAAREKEKGNELFKAREYRSAIEAYDVSIALDATTPAPFANRAAAYMKLRRWSDAARDCDAALALDPENFKALLRRGACVLEANEEDAASRALEDFELCAAIEAKRKKDASEPSDAELVRLTTKARKMLSDAKTKAARAAMRRVAIEEDDETIATCSSSSTVSKSVSTKDASAPVSSARMGPMVIEEIVEDSAPAAAPSRVKIVIEEASDSDDDDASAASPDLAARVAALKDEGNACFARGAYDEAIERYDEAIRAVADSDGADENETSARNKKKVDARARAVLYANRAASLLKRGDFARAERDANDAVSCDASYIKGFHRRAAARTGLHKFEGALEDYEKVVRATPESAALQREVNACMEKAAEAMLGGLAGDARGDIAAALSGGAKAVAIEPDSDDDSDEDESRDAPTEAAMEAAKKPPAPAPTSPATRARTIAIVEEDSSDDEEDETRVTETSAAVAVTTTERKPTPSSSTVAKDHPSVPKDAPSEPSSAFSAAVAHKDRGNALFRVGDFAGAEAAYSAAVAADPSAAAFYANRAAARLKLGAHEDALRDADAALALDPAHARARHRRAAALAKLGPSRAAEAAEEYARVAAAHPDHAGVAAEAEAAAEAASRFFAEFDSKSSSLPPRGAFEKKEEGDPRRELPVDGPASVSETRTRKKPTPTPRAPRTATELERGCVSLRDDPEALLAFLTSVADEALPALLKHSVSAKILGAYCVAFERAVAGDGDGASAASREKNASFDAKKKTAATLAALARSPRFALAAASLAAADKAAIARVFDALGEACASETRDAWR